MKKIKNLIKMFVVLMCLVACEKENNEILNETLETENIELINNPVLEIISSMGFNTKDVIEYGDYYIIEGDLTFSKNIEDYKNVYNLTGKHANTDNLVSTNYRIVTVGIDPSIPYSGSDNWRSEVSSAMSAWSNITNCSLKFVHYYGLNPDILITSDNNTLPSNTMASTSFPYGGKAGADSRFGLSGGIIKINLDFGGYQNGPIYDVSVPSSTKKYVLIHEMGHTLGLRHTNNWDIEGSAGVGANAIPVTPSADDPNSIMNGATPYSTWNWSNFSAYDIAAVKYLYPDVSCNFRLVGPNGECAFDKWGDRIEYGVYALDGDELTNQTSNWYVSGSEIEIITSNTYGCKVRPKADVTNWPATGTITLLTNGGCTKTYDVIINNCIDYNYSD